MALQRVAERCGGSFGIGVRAARRLGDDLVDHAEREEVLRGDLERFRCPLALARVLPENRGAALGRDDGIDGVLEHQHAIGEPDRERAARAAFADDRRDDGCLQRRHLDQAACDRFRLTAFLGPQSRIGAGRVDERDDRCGELRGQAHEPHRFPVAFGMRHPEVAIQILLGVPPLLMADDHDARAVEPCPATDDRRVVPIQPVAMELDEVGEDGVDIVERVGTAHKVADDVCTEVAGPLNDIASDASALLDDYIGNDDLRNKLHGIMENVQSIRRSLPDAAHAPEVFNQALPRPRPHTRYRQQLTLPIAHLPPLAMIRHSKTVGFVPRLLQQPKSWRAA